MIGRLFVVLLLVAICIYTLSFGVWTWKQKNRLGGVAVMLLALASLFLPIYGLFFKDQ